MALAIALPLVPILFPRSLTDKSRFLLKIKAGELFFKPVRGSLVNDPAETSAQVFVKVSVKMSVKRYL